MWFHWQRETHFTQHAWCSQSLLNSAHSLLLLKYPTHMHALTVAKISALTVLNRTVLLLCRQTSRLSSSGAPIHQTGTDQPAAAACLCLFGPAQNLAMLHLAVTQLQNHLPEPLPVRLMSSQSMEQSPRCRGPLMEPLDTYRLDQRH